MSKKSPNSGKIPEIHCPECQFRLDPQLIQLLLSGKTVYCEQCGFPFHGIEAGEVKPLEKKQEDQLQQKNLTKEEIQWIEWKKEWQKLKASFKNNISSFVSEIFPRSSREPKKQTLTSQSYPQLETDKIQDSKITPLKTAEKVLLDLTPFYYSIILLITFLTSLFSRSWFHLIGLLIIQFYVIYYDHREFIFQERNNHVSHAGIPMIIIGLVSLGANAIGAFLLARGIISLLIFIEDVRSVSKQHPIIHANPLIQMIWLREIVFSFIPYIFGILITFFTSEIIRKLGILVLEHRNLANFLYSLISGGIIIVILFVQIIPYLKSQKIQNMPTEKAVILIICGIFSLNFGVGIFLIILGILILNFQSYRKKNNQDLPEISEIRDLVDLLVYPSSFEKAEKAEKASTLKRTPSVSEELKTPIAPIPYERPKNYQKKRFDPQTGEPISTIDQIIPESRNQRLDMERQQKKPAYLRKEPTQPAITDFSTITQEHIRPVPREGEIFQLIYTVLEPEIRVRLLQLNISDKEKDEISKSFIYLTLKQQKKYLNELELVNSIVEKVNTKYINQIRSLNIPREQQDFLIQQLNYLPEEELDEYLYVLKKNMQN